MEKSEDKKLKLRKIIEKNVPRTSFSLRDNIIIHEHSYGRYIYQKVYKYKKRLIVYDLSTKVYIFKDTAVDVQKYTKISRQTISKYMEQGLLKNNFYISSVYNMIEVTTKKIRRFKKELSSRFKDLHHNIRKRCTDVNRYPSYKGCTYDKNWVNYDLFIEDIMKIDGYSVWAKCTDNSMSLDKDIKIKGNKHYCVEACSFVTRSENSKEAQRRRKPIKYKPIDKNKYSSHAVTRDYFIRMMCKKYKYTFEDFEETFSGCIVNGHTKKYYYKYIN